jgi:hypothetical protein
VRPLDTGRCDSGAKDAARFRARDVLRDESAVCVRAIRPDDKEHLRKGFERLSYQSVYRRFLHPARALTADQLRHLTEIDFRDHVARFEPARRDRRKTDRDQSLCACPPAADRAKIAVTVADEY